MTLGIITLLVALCISAIAAYYSILGLTAIFAAAVVPIILMGTVLEIGKIFTTVWLHWFWHRAPRAIKIYLTSAVIILMFITSMGVFGFLSRAHIEQTAASRESIAQVTRLSTEIARQQAIISRAEEKINKLETQGTGGQANIQSQIDKEQARIDNAYKRIQPAIDEQNRIIADVAGIYQAELTKIDNQLSKLQTYIDNSEIKKAQQMVGARADGAFGPRTAQAFRDFQDRKNQERQDLLQKIQDSMDSPVVKNARSEISRLRSVAEKQIQQSNKLINTFRDQLRQDDTSNVPELIEEQLSKIKSANLVIDDFTQEKYSLEAVTRKLEAEVGPVKYIAELIYGNADRNLLESAVRWVTIILVAVFDPLAVCLVLAGTMTIDWARSDKKRREEGLPPEDPRVKELEMELEKHNEVLAELEKLLDSNLEKIDPDEYTRLEEQYTNVVEERQVLANALSEAKEQNDLLVDKIVDTEAQRDEFKNKLDQISEDTTAHNKRTEELLEKITVLESEIERRDVVVLKMAEKYQLVEKDSFGDDLVKQASQDPLDIAKKYK